MTQPHSKAIYEVSRTETSFQKSGQRNRWNTINTWSDWLPQPHSLQTLELRECSVELATEINAVRSRRQLMSSGRVLSYTLGQ